jgi:hypothetical protein
MVFSETPRTSVEMSFMLAVPLFFITDKIASRLSFIGLSVTPSMSFICPLRLAGAARVGVRFPV